jgi:hypothetical protein
MLHVFIGKILANMTRVSDVDPGPLVVYSLAKVLFIEFASLVWLLSLCIFALWMT